MVGKEIFIWVKLFWGGNRFPMVIHNCGVKKTVLIRGHGLRNANYHIVRYGNDSEVEGFVMQN